MLLNSIYRYLHTLWQTEFAVYRSREPDAGAIRSRHLTTLARYTPVMMVCNMLAGPMLAAALIDAVPPRELLAWLAVLYALCLHELAAWQRNRFRRPAAVSTRAIPRTVRSAIALATPWAVATALWCQPIGSDGRLLLWSTVIGFMCAGAFMLSSMPQAALAYLSVMSLGGLVGLARIDGLASLYLQVMVLAYFVTLAHCVLINSRTHTARLRSEREAERKGQLVELLLRDFEEHSADLLWEIDVHGRLCHFSRRLADLAGRSPDELRGCGLLGALRRGSHEPGENEPLVRLGLALAGSRPFRDLPVPVSTCQGPRWWSVTAKPLLDESGSRVGWRGVIGDITSTRAAQQRMQQLAHFDALTGLTNRALLAERVGEALHRYGRDGPAAQPLALLMLDIDHFKSINDSFGHGVGDAVLIEVARRLQAASRRSDLPARLGSDGFVIVVDPVRDLDEVRSLADRLIASLAEPCRTFDHTLTITASIGTAIAPVHGLTLDELLTHAGLALQEAKAAGRARCVLFEAGLGDRYRRRILIANELRGALARAELELAWQPQVALADRRLHSAEVLLRWQHPKLGQVSPAEFIPVAEDSGQIIEIGAWVLREACRCLAAMPEIGSVAVNASPAQLMREDFPAVVRAALDATGLSPQRLTVEITESLFIDAAPVALANLHALRELGVRIELDDFGTGYSSLAYLRRFPFDGLKIDRAFVRELPQRDDARAIVRAIVELARSMGMTTVAEGIEDEQQLTILRDAGCVMAQGYLLARPMPVAQLAQWLHNPGNAAIGAARPPTFLPSPAPRGDSPDLPCAEPAVA